MHDVLNAWKGALAIVYKMRQLYHIAKKLVRLQNNMPPARVDFQDWPCLSRCF